MKKLFYLTRLVRPRYPFPRRVRWDRCVGKHAVLGSLPLVVCLALHPVEPSFAQQTNVQLKTSVDSTKVTIGDVVTVKLATKHPETMKLAFQSVGSSLGEWTVRSAKTLPTTKLEGGIVEDTLELQLATYKTGDFDIPSLNVETVTASGKKEVLTSEPIKIAVQSVLTGNEDTLKDLKPQAEIEADYKPFLFLLAALASTAYLIYRLVLYLKRRKKPVAAKPERIRSPEEVAREAIERLLARKLVEQGHLKQFYLELSEIIKRFLGSKLGVRSLERTTEEFARDLRAVSVPSSQYRMIREFLEDCDLVKFAKYHPGTDEVERIVARSRGMIEGTHEEAMKPQAAEVIQ